MASKRESILDNIVTVLAAIATGGGYNNTMGEVLLGLKHFEQTPTDKFPAAYITGADESVVNSSQASFMSEMHIPVIGYAVVADASDVSQLEREVSRMLADFRKALMLDVTRGGVAVTTELGNVKTDKGAWVPYAGFELTVKVKYRATFVAP